MLNQYRPNLARLRGVALDVGGRDKCPFGGSLSGSRTSVTVIVSQLNPNKRFLHPLPVLLGAGRALRRAGQWRTWAAWSPIRWVDKRVARRMAEERLLGSAGRMGSVNE